MDGSGSISFPWGDGEHTFKLGLKEWRELQAKTDAGPLELLERVQQNKWRVDDLRETIRLGLIGGGMEPTDATKLLGGYFDDTDRTPLVKQQRPAALILMASLVGPVEDDEQKKVKAKTKEAPSASTSQK